ncbi:MAG TPA: hypothetical protein DDY91_03835, partial [Planctomycetaceae bacterium]|nr:hypothetical protein [Planctomycetaceae bacterium]
RGTDGYEPALMSVQMKFPNYELIGTTEDDPDWNLYFEQLYPSELNLLSIKNRRHTEHLASLGDQLHEPRPVKHSIHFASPHAREQFVKSIAAEGFEISLNETPEPDAEYRYGVELTRRDRVDLDSIDGMAVDLSLRIMEWGGEYDGWDAVPVLGRS